MKYNHARVQSLCSAFHTKRTVDGPCIPLYRVVISTTITLWQTECYMDRYTTQEKSFIGSDSCILPLPRVASLLPVQSQLQSQLSQTQDFSLTKPTTCLWCAITAHMISTFTHTVMEKEARTCYDHAFLISNTTN